jgi:glycosyltransferase involved in cell wall biosynthesis
MPRIAGIIVNLVPYHHARWEAFSRLSGNEAHLVALTDRDPFRALEFSSSSSYFKHTLFPHKEANKFSADSMRKRMFSILDAIRPDVVCVSGWGIAVSLVAMIWAITRGVPLVMLSESNEFDESRSFLKEYLKRRIVSLCGAGLAGGAPQAHYLVKLGIPGECVFQGYDVVDNGFFRKNAKEIRDSGLLIKDAEGRTVSSPYFLACARFGKKKNLPGLIRSYALYRQMVGSSGNGCESTVGHIKCRVERGYAVTSVFDLVIVGEGEERGSIENAIREAGVGDHVHLVGPKGYTELPAYYANAGAFIHASTTEQWGLVVNEAMASGLPVLVSNRCGCIMDLVKEGLNGWTFEPNDLTQLAQFMVKMSTDEERRLEMGRASPGIISEWDTDRFFSGLSAAVDVTLAKPKRAYHLFDGLILRLLSRHT